VNVWQAEEEASQRNAFFRKVLSNLDAQHQATLARKDVIEKQKVRSAGMKRQSRLYKDQIERI
jgi:hypothetical protein